MRSVLRAVGPALAAVAVVVALEWPLRAAIEAASPRYPTPWMLHGRTFTRDIWAADRVRRSCAQDSGALVHLTGGCPTRDLDMEMLARELAPLGAAPCSAAFTGGLMPIEMHAYMPQLLSPRPRALVMHVGTLTFEPYDLRTQSRLAYFNAEETLPVLSFRQLWDLRVQLAHSLAGRAAVAFRYRYLVRSAFWPGRYDRPGPGPFDLSSSQETGLELGRGEQLRLFDDFLARWTATGIPLIVWDSPRDSSFAPNRQWSTPQELLGTLEMVRASCRRHGVRFVGPDELPAFAPEDFRFQTQLTDAGGARLTKAMIPFIRSALSAGERGADPTPAPASRRETSPGTGEGKPTRRTARKTER